MNLTIYEEYCSSLHGNQQYILLLLEGSKGLQLRCELVVPYPADLSSEAAKIGSVTVLNSRFHRNVFLNMIKLWNVLFKQKPDVILCNNERSLLIVGLVARLRGIPLLWYVKNMRAVLWSDLLCSILATRVLSISPSLMTNKAAIIRRLCTKKGEILPIGIPLSKFQEVAAPRPVSGQLRVLMLAAITPAKGHEVLLNAIKSLNTEADGIEVRIAGGTPRGCEDFARCLSTKTSALKYGTMKLLGWQQDTASLLEWADVLVLPSLNEGVPRSLVEAMAAGRPVIATDVGGVRDVVRHGCTGLIVPAGDSGALAQAIMHLKNNHAELVRMGDEGRDWANQFNIEVHLSRLASILKDVAQRTGSVRDSISA